jgi:hypothetical protein
MKKISLLKRAIDIGRKSGHIFLVTADQYGMPHLSIATKISLASDSQLWVAGWFCPGIVENLEMNPNIGVAVWDEGNDAGYQLLGKKLELNAIAIMDGYSPELENKPPLPQVEREVRIAIEKILEFKQAPHSDLEENRIPALMER